MTIPLKYNTASQEIPLGYFVDSSDGDTEETGLTINNTDIKLWKSGATTLANKNSGGATHISNGLYYCTLDATDTNTYGPLVIFVHVSGALACRVECTVMEANAYDALYAASGTGHVECDVVQISGDGTAADNAELAFDGTGYGFTNCTMPTVTTLTGHTAQTGDNYARLGAPAGASVSADIAANQADLNTILDDTNELQTDWTNGGRLDLILDELTTQGDTNEGKIDVVDGLADAILEDTGTTLPASIAALNDISVANITGAEVDNDGTAISLAGALKLILAVLTGKSSGGATDTLVFRDINDSKNRISATVDGNGNRTAVGTRDAT